MEDIATTMVWVSQARLDDTLNKFESGLLLMSFEEVVTELNEVVRGFESAAGVLEKFYPGSEVVQTARDGVEGCWGLLKRIQRVHEFGRW